MTLIVERHRVGSAPATDRRSPESGRDRKTGPIVNVALINNMPDTAVAATERQFRRLLRVAAEDRIVRLHCFSLPSVPRSSETLAALEGLYGQVSDLRRMTIDGLVVTGTEPQAASLRDEPFWPALTGLVDWAREATVSTIWSCLAAHAAVLHLDGIKRRRLPAKCSGVFACATSGPHWMLERTGPSLAVPHSRLNALDPAELAARGYDILTRSSEAGVDMFAKRLGGSEFIFLQGHPEYSASALKHEYTRDLRRYLARQSDVLPELPAHYFDARTEQDARAFLMGVPESRTLALLDDLPHLTVRAAAVEDPQRAGEAIIRNWVDYLFRRKALAKGKPPVSRQARPEPSSAQRSVDAGPADAREIRRATSARDATLRQMRGR